MTADSALDAIEFEFVAVVGLREPRAATGDVNPFFREVAVSVLDAVKRGLREFLAGEARRVSVGRLKASAR